MIKTTKCQLEVAHFLCDLSDDEWSLGKKFWISSAKDLLKIVDKHGRKKRAK